MTRFDGLFDKKRRSPYSNIQASEHLDSEPEQQPSEEEKKNIELPNVQTSKHPCTQTPKLTKSNDPAYQRSTIYLPKELHQRLKLAALQDNSEISEVIETLVADWLESRDR